MRGAESSSFYLVKSKKVKKIIKKMFTTRQEDANINRCENLADIQDLDTPTGS